MTGAGGVRRLSFLSEWAKKEPDVEAVAVVGSWARGEATGESDVDIVLLTASPERFIE